MRKIPTLFLRDTECLALVSRDLNPACAWVIAGEGVATRKYDGTCVRLTNDGLWWARREVKEGKVAPRGYVPVEMDPITYKTVGWEPIEQSAFAKFHAEALAHCPDDPVAPLTPGTYELIGPRANGNPENVGEHLLIAHSRAEMLCAVDDFLRGAVDVAEAYAGLLIHLAHAPIEGIVWHHPDGRMAKLKGRDFGHRRAAR